jgi:hypothetical protein
MLKITEQYGLGRAKYVVNYYTGKKHEDGSEFYDIRIFTNKRLKDRFIRELENAEYHSERKR